MRSHIGCICMIFPLNELSNASPNHVHQRMQNYIGCICTILLWSVFSNVSSIYLHRQLHSHIDCICLLFLRNELWSVPSNCLPVQMQSYIGCIDTIFLAGTGVAPTLHPFMDVELPPLYIHSWMLLYPVSSLTFMFYWGGVISWWMLFSYV